MEQTIKINVPEGKVAKYNEETQTIEFVDKEPIRSKSWKEFCKNHPLKKTECYISSYGQIEQMIYIPNETKREFPNILETKEDAEGILALIQLTRLHDEWVGNWKPDWTDFDAKPCCIVYVDYLNEIFINEFMNIGHRVLSFPTMEMAAEFKNCFSDLILKAKKFIY